jgi:hypothetical protein
MEGEKIMAAYELNFVYSLKTTGHQIAESNPSVPIVYGQSKSHPSIIVSELPYLKGVRLPRHKRSGTLFCARMILDPIQDSPIFADRWEYVTFYQIWDNSKHNLLHVQEWMQSAPATAARLDGKLLLYMKVIK